jgi:lysophospholipase L1-like esterase
MPASSDGATARQIIADPAYAGNLQLDTLVAAFSDAQFAVVMLGTNDPASSGRLADIQTVVDKLEAAGIVPILSTVPPRNDAFSNQLNIDFNAGVRALAQARSLPLIDFYQEILLRRPGTTWFNTLISSDGVHPTASGAGFGVSSDPYAAGGDPGTHTTGDAAANVGYLLRSWLTVQKLKEVKLHIVDRIDP